MAFRPYLAFAGNCREAFTRYQEIFGGELVLLTLADTPAEAGPPPAGANPDAIMHAALRAPDALLMGGDDPSGQFDGNNRGMCLNVSLPDPGEAKRVFDALAEGGTVQQPISETFFSPAFGMCIDRFGTPWMVMVDMPNPT
jgi:PhnB protein